MKEFINKLIERLEESQAKIEFALKGCNVNEFIQVKAVKRIINQLAEEYDQTIDVAELVEKFGQKKVRSNDGWIPCSRELPPQPKENPLYEGKTLEIYLVCTSDGDLPFRAFWNGEFFTQGFAREDVIAWQPLPEVFKL